MFRLTSINVAWEWRMMQLIVSFLQFCQLSFVQFVHFISLHPVANIEVKDAASRYYT
ncbi:hypothetical protein H1230_21310 [Paenibacillus sp. 19GGS1-52]|uniref:hypothetical protein n=1 Tax=Paenibacillus sp. 19GGS1-52 TaxID=2758563 RepID=UPI001EFB2C98|nr:hypothetical protein [Paenibacillus sp. 19GGS1-52]ULO05599.1 hypothetical protein H1230_21310 [Paenibacillus sp. 19GGS1-52]